MLRLRVFGGLTLARGNAPLTGAVTQRRRLAILALLAVAGDRGLSRDKLLAYLWPESDAEHARHTLNQLLYAQRTQAGTPGLFAGRKSLRLDPHAIWTDVAAFEEALANGDLAAAVELYAGPFLDGFFLKDAPEFERWVESQRDRFARRCGDAVASLATRAAAAGDRAGAVRWWRRVLELDPLDSQRAAALIHSLVEAGNRPEAVRVARAHTATIERELGVAVDQRFLEEVSRILGGEA